MAVRMPRGQVSGEVSGSLAFGVFGNFDRRRREPKNFKTLWILNTRKRTRKLQLTEVRHNGD